MIYFILLYYIQYIRYYYYKHPRVLSILGGEIFLCLISCIKKDVLFFQKLNIFDLSDNVQSYPL